MFHLISTLYLVLLAITTTISFRFNIGNIGGTYSSPNEDYTPQGRVIGGTDAPEGKYPYQVSMQSSGQHFCGGSIIDSRTILTAAHCIVGKDVDKFKIRVGTNSVTKGGVTYGVKKIIQHEKYDKLENDIALVIVDKEIEFNDKVQPISLPKADVEEGTDVVLTGWGTSSFRRFLNLSFLPPTTKNPDKLQHIQLKTISNKQCQDDHKQHAVYETNVCTFTEKGEGACYGDSGGPLVHAKEIVGVVSWGDPCANGKADVFTRVFRYLDWIEKNRKID